MRIRSLAAVTAALAVGLTGQASAATPDRCTLKKGKVVAQQGKVRVLERQKDLYACYGKRKPFPVFDGASNEDALGLTLAGRRYIAFVDRRIAPVDGIPDVQLRVFDVRTGKGNGTPVGDAVGGELGTFDGVTSGGPVQLALSGTGVAALKQTLELLVLSSTPGADPVIVATGNDIAEVAASRNTIYWTTAAGVFSTPAAAPVAAPAPAG